MTFFLIVGILVTLLIAGGGAAGWTLIGRRTGAGSGKRRHRDEARRMQERFEADEDFTRNFHRPTQNELLETLQALDHLTADWQGGSADVVEHRFKNELAESFPTLRKAHCTYPKTVAEDQARLVGKAKLSPEALGERERRHAEKIAQARSAFHAARAQANAMHQITSGPQIGPVEITAGSLPFRVREEPSARGRKAARGGVAAVAAVLITGCLGTGWYFYSHADAREKLLASIRGSAGTTAGMDTTPKATDPPAQVVQGASVAMIPSGANGAAVSPPEPLAGAVAQTPAPAAADHAVGPGEPAPPPTPVLATAPASTQTPAVTLAQRVAYSQQRAIERFPDLAVPNSEINLRFVFRYKRLADEKSPRLQDPSWPEKLAEECAAAVAGPKSKKVSQVNTAHR